jgi:hypothetical protein
MLNADRKSLPAVVTEKPGGRVASGARRLPVRTGKYLPSGQLLFEVLGTQDRFVALVQSRQGMGDAFGVGPAVRGWSRFLAVE